MINILFLFLSLSVFAREATNMEKLIAKGASVGCVRALMHERGEDMVTDGITKFCENMYWEIIREQIKANQ